MSVSFSKEIENISEIQKFNPTIKFWTLCKNKNEEDNFGLLEM